MSKASEDGEMSRALDDRTFSKNSEAQVIFFGNGPLAEHALGVLNQHFEVIFHARTREDLEEVKRIKAESPEAHGILASYGVIIPRAVLEIFEPEGILNIHPSLLPQYRGPSPIETAILNGDKEFSVSIMKLAPEMDAGPLYASFTLGEEEIKEFGGGSDGLTRSSGGLAKDLDGLAENSDSGRPAEKAEIYRALAVTGAEWLVKNLEKLPEPVAQVGEPSFTKMLDKSMSPLEPEKKTAAELLNQVRAFAGFPKSKCAFSGLECTVISAHVASKEELSAIKTSSENNANTAKNGSAGAVKTESGNIDAVGCYNNVHTLYIQCYDGSVLVVDSLQPAGRKVMDAKSFINGYCKKS